MLVEAVVIINEHKLSSQATMSVTDTKEVFQHCLLWTDKGESDTSSVCSSEEDGIPLPPISVVPTEILPVDANSPDKYVPRDPRLIRLTGNHPFNCEAPLTELFDAGSLSR